MREQIIRVVVLIAASVLAGCGGDDNEYSGPRVDGTDTTPPSASLSVAVAAGGPTVSAGLPGSQTDLVARSRTAILNLLSSGKDEESGIRALQILGTTAIMHCLQGTNACTTSQPTVGAPLFATSEAQLNSGDPMSVASIMAHPLDLSTLIPADADGARLELWVESFNHVGRNANTGRVRVLWSRR